MKPASFLARSLDELRIKTEAHEALWHISQADWSVDQDAGTIVFTAPNGLVATCPVQILGTFNTADGTWLWAWDHPSVEPALAVHAAKLRAYGQKHKIADLTTRKLRTTEERCWEFTAMACKLNDAQGGYRGPAGEALVFMTFGTPTLSGKKTKRPTRAKAPRKAGGRFTRAIPDDVRATVEGFIAALHAWEIAAWKASEADGSSRTIAAIKRSHKALIRRWCVPEPTARGISYGKPPKHHPKTEQLVSSAVSKDRCKVRTHYTNVHGWESDYEYHLRRHGGKWLVQNLYYVDGDERIRML